MHLVPFDCIIDFLFNYYFLAHPSACMKENLTKNYNTSQEFPEPQAKYLNDNFELYNGWDKEKSYQIPTHFA